jgi:hypothetical protein
VLLAARKRRILRIGVPIGLVLIAVVAGLLMYGGRQDAIALYEASEAGNVTAVRRLLDRGVSPSAAHRVLAVPDAGVKPVVKRVALLAAASEGHTEVVRLLLDRGADIEATNEWDQTALLVAARHSKFDPHKIETVRLLLERGANKQATCERGLTAMMWAVNYGSPEVQALLSGSDPDAQPAGQAGPP